MSVRRDAHREALHLITAHLVERFPGAGIGITGSLAVDSHRPDSDIDLIITDDQFVVDLQYSLLVNKIPVAIIALHPEGSEDRRTRWECGVFGEDRTLHMIRAARIIRDPSGSFERLKAVSGVACLDSNVQRRQTCAMLRSALATVDDPLHDSPSTRARIAFLALHLSRLALSLDQSIGKREDRAIRNELFQRDIGLQRALRQSLCYRQTSELKAAVGQLIRAAIVLDESA